MSDADRNIDRAADRVDEEAVESRRTPGAGRRELVLDSALLTFARFGYRKTSMDEIARGAEISRPGLYFFFRSKEELFRAAALQALAHDLAAVEVALADEARPIRDRLLDAFDQWTGRYVGPLSRDIASVIEDNPALLGSIVTEMPARFAALIDAALARAAGVHAATTSNPVTQTLILTAIGAKHQSESRDEFRQRMRVGIGLIVR